MADSPRRRIDPRLLIGILVIVASVIGAVSLVMALDRTATAWAAPHDLIAGDVIRLGDLQPRPVRLDLVEGAYLIGDLDADAQLVVLRTVGGGELVPLGAVGDVAAIETAVIVVPVAATICPEPSLPVDKFPVRKLLSIVPAERNIALNAISTPAEPSAASFSTSSNPS